MSSRSFLNRTEMYERAMAMTNRLHELQDIHKWTSEEATLALKILDEPLSITLHTTGSCVTFVFRDQSPQGSVQPSNPLSVRKDRRS